MKVFVEKMEFILEFQNKIYPNKTLNVYGPHDKYDLENPTFLEQQLQK